MKLLKKLLLFVMLCLLVLPYDAYAEHFGPGGTCGENLTWVLQLDGTLTISGTGAMTDYGPSYAENISVPWNCADIKTVIIEEGVTSIGNNAFVACSNLTVVTMPDSITRIGEHAFENCFNLAKADIPASVAEIGEYAFGGCKALSAVVIPDGITEIADFAFENCVALEEVKLPAGLSSIGKYAFRYCPSLQSIVIPSSVTYIDRCAFDECEKLGHILYAGTGEQWAAVTLRYGAIPDGAGITYNYVSGMEYHVFLNDCAAKCTHCAYTRDADHSWNEGVTEGNVITFTCSVCGDTMQDYIETVDPIYPPNEDDPSQATQPWDDSKPTEPPQSSGTPTTEPDFICGLEPLDDAPDSNNIIILAAVGGTISLLIIAIAVVVVRKKK